MKMNEEHREAEGRFYKKCAEMLGAAHQYQPWDGRPPNRWNNRHPGNGRFAGFGAIRMFSPSCIHVCLRHPVGVNQMCYSTEEAFNLLEKILKQD